MRQRPRQVACGPHRFLARMTRVFSAAAQISDGGHGNLMSIDRFSSHRHAKSPARDQALTCAELSAQRICGALTGCPLRGSGRMRRPATRSRWPARPGRSSGARARSSAARPGEPGGRAASWQAWQRPAAVVTWWLAATASAYPTRRCSSPRAGPGQRHTHLITCDPGSRSARIQRPADHAAGQLRRGREHGALRGAAVGRRLATGAA
jgi:hypothetical protein